LDHFEGSKEAVRASHCVGIGIKGNNPAVNKRDDIVSVEGFASNFSEVGRFSSRDESVMDELESVVES
jgi:hypothetical protein